MDFDFKKAQKERDTIDRLLREMPEKGLDLSVLREYVTKELPQVAPGNRINMRSLSYSGKIAAMAMLISEERLISKIRWGDLINRLHEEVVQELPAFRPVGILGNLDQLHLQD